MTDTEMMISEKIQAVFKSYKLELSDQMLASIEKEVEGRSPRNPNALAYTIARNKAVDIIRQAISDRRKATRKAEREAEKAEAAEAERQRQLVFESADAEREFLEAAAKALPSASPKFTPPFVTLWLRCFKRADYSMLCRIYPALSKDAIRQRVSRVYKRISPFVAADSALQKVLNLTMKKQKL